MLLIDDFLERADREAILAELRGASGSAATVYAGAPTGRVAPTVRKATRLVASTATRDVLASTSLVGRCLTSRSALVRS
ncbi:MAG: hypothetical protein IPO58_11940 [Betaproteobacteria bacterium]|nr:hypothetical protein [Betaproteobacteria bacterium]